MFHTPPKPNPAIQMQLFYRARFNIGFRNTIAANANPGYYPCPLVAGPLDSYWDSLKSGSIGPEDMENVTRAFEDAMAKVHRRDDCEQLRACILESLWLKPYSKHKEERRKRAAAEKRRLEYAAYAARIKERERIKNARAEAFCKKREKQSRPRAVDALEEGEVEEAEEGEIAVKREQ